MNRSNRLSLLSACLILAHAGVLSAATPSYYRKRTTWRESLLASMQAKEGGTAAKPKPLSPQDKAWKPVKSPVMKKGRKAHLMKADVTGQTVLSLVVGEATGGNRGDQAVWADAKLTTADGKEVWLDTLTPIQAVVGQGRFTARRRKVTIGKTEYERHLSVHAPGVVTYKLDPARRYKTFEAYVGINVNTRKGGTADFWLANKKVPAPRRAAAPGDISDHEIWAPLLADFPQNMAIIMAAKDWCRRDGIKIDAPTGDFEAKAKATLDHARKTLAYVAKSTPTGKLAAAVKAIEAQLARGGDWRKGWLDAHRLRRVIILSHPAINFQNILVNVNPPTKYSHNGDQHLGRHSREGKGMGILSNWKTEAAKVDFFLKGKLPVGAIRNPSLHYDAKKVAFAFCDHTREGQRRYFIWEANLDGTGVRQLTGTKRDTFGTWDGRATVIIEDNDPAYLPDDHLIFISTRCQTFGRCHGGRYNPAWTLHRCDPNGSNITQLSYGNENEYNPSVLNDGRIAFTRWEYTNRHEMLFHMLWWCRPDGTAPTHFYGNDTLHPMQVLECKAIPGTHKVVTTMQGHHSYTTGTTVIIDTNLGENGEEPLTHITPETPYSESHGNGWPNPHYSHPWPINAELFLASRANHRVHKQGMTPPPANRGIYLVDPTGRELIYEDPTMATVSPIGIRKRKRPPVLPPMTAPGAEPYGTIFLQNAYLTRNDPEGVIKPGMIKAVRVIALGVQPRARRSPCHMQVRVEIPKKVIGTVPVNADGSAVFKVPANVSLQMQTLDENGMAILTEKSLFYVQPGEMRSCVGCHEPVGMTPDASLFAKMARIKPMDLTPAAGPQYKGGLSFMRTVQPVLDRYCIGCHGLGGAPADKRAKADKINLVHDGKISWPRPYQELFTRGDHRVGDKGYMSGELNISRPRRFYAYSNKVSHMLVKNHGKCNMDRDSRMRIIEWMDVNAQCYGDLFPNKLEERGIDAAALAQLRAYAKTVVGAKMAAQPDRALINVAQPDQSRILLAPLPAGAGGWGQVKGFASKSDPRYKKMAALVDTCIVRKPNENTNGWEPTWDMGGGESWVIEDRKKLIADLKGK